jgi:hypothetical protein
MGKRKRKQKNGMQVVVGATPEAVLPTPEFMARNVLEKVKTDQGHRTLRVQDKRPIDKYYRLYCIDLDRGIGEQYRRGITEPQFRAADRIANNYERSFPKVAMQLDAVRVQTSVNVGMYPVESLMHAIHTLTRVRRVLSVLWREMIEAVCCKESRLSEFEQARGWREGYGMIRLREALDELVEAFRLLGKANR